MPVRFGAYVLLVGLSAVVGRRPPHYEPYESDRLPDDRQIAGRLDAGGKRILFYYSTVAKGALSATLTTCKAPIEWSMWYTPDNTTAEPNEWWTTEDTTIRHLQVRQGFYVVKLTAPRAATEFYLYISTEVGGPQALQKAKNQQLKLVQRQRRKRLTVRWNPSLVDPQATDYCLMVNTERHYKSFCQAFIHATTECVGKKTQTTLANLKSGQTYHLDLFAFDHESNFTYLYASTTTIFSPKIKPIKLKDAKPSYVNLKKFDGRAVLKFKITKKNRGEPLVIFLMLCGGAVNIEVMLKDRTVMTKQRIEGFGEVSIQKPVEAGRYYLKLTASSREELRKISGVVVYATAKSPKRIPFPSMPLDAKVVEYVSLRKCDRVIIGWEAITDHKIAHYCVVVKEGKIQDNEDYYRPNQCNLENRLRKSADFVVKYCKDFEYKSQVITQEISHLKPGKDYIVQVTVKKPKGKTLSYNLLQISTNPSCEMSGY